MENYAKYEYFILHLLGDPYLSPDVGNFVTTVATIFSEKITMLKDEHLRDHTEHILKISLDNYANIEKAVSNIYPSGKKIGIGPESQAKFYFAKCYEIAQTYSALFLQSRTDLILFSGYNSDNGGHAITLYLERQDDAAVIKVTVCNSGAGVGYHGNGCSTSGEKQCIGSAYLDADKVEYLFMHFILHEYKNKHISYEKTVRTFYAGLYDILYCVQSYIDYLNVCLNSLVAKNYNSPTKNLPLDVDYNTAYCCAPQRSGSCTFYCIYYWFFYCCLQANKERVFYDFMSDLRIHFMLEMIKKFRVEKLTFNNYKLCEMMIGHYVTYSNICEEFKNFEESDIYAEKYNSIADEIESLRTIPCVNHSFDEASSDALRNKMYKLSPQIEQQSLFTELEKIENAWMKQDKYTIEDINGVLKVYKDMMYIANVRQISSLASKSIILIFSVGKYLKRLHTIDLNLDKQNDNAIKNATSALSRLLGILQTIPRTLITSYTEEAKSLNMDIFFHPILLLFSFAWNIANSLDNISDYFHPNIDNYHSFLDNRKFLFDQPSSILDSTDMETICSRIVSISALLPSSYNKEYHIAHTTFNKYFHETNFIIHPKKDYQYGKTSYDSNMEPIFELDKIIAMTHYKSALIYWVTVLAKFDLGSEGIIFPIIRRDTRDKYGLTIDILQGHIQTAKITSAVAKTEISNIGNYLFFEIFDIVEVGDIDLVNGYAGNWSDSIFPALTFFHYGDLLKMNDIILTVANGGAGEGESEWASMEKLQILARKNNRLPLYDMFNESFRKIISKKSLFQKSQLKKVRSDFLLLLATLSAQCYCMGENDSMLLELKDRIEAGDKFTNYFKVLYTILNQSTIGTNYFKEIYDYRYNADNLYHYLVSILALKKDLHLLAKYELRNDSADIISNYYKEKINLFPNTLIFIEYSFTIGSTTYDKYYRYTIKASADENAHDTFLSHGILLRDDANDKILVQGQMYDLKTTDSNLVYVQRGLFTFVDIDGTSASASASASNSKIVAFIIQLKKISRNVQIWRYKAELIYKIELPDHGIFFICRNNTLYYGRKEIIFNNDDINLFSRWVYGIENALLLRDGSKYEILLLNYATNLELLNEISAQFDSCWLKLKSQANFIFDGTHVFLSLHEHGLSIENPQKENMQAYLSSVCLFGNGEILEMIYDQARILKCIPLKIMNGLDLAINHPYRFYFINNYEVTDQRYLLPSGMNISEYDDRKNAYIQKYLVGPKVNWLKDVDVNLKHIIATPEILSILKQIEELFNMDDGKTCTINNNFYEQARAIIGHKDALVKEQTQIKIALQNAYINSFKLLDHNLRLIFENYHAFYRYIYLSALLKIIDGIKDVAKYSQVNCQLLAEFKNLIQIDNLYTGPRQNFVTYFEILFGNIIRKDQHDLIARIEDNVANLNVDKEIYQMLMGKGKTSVIAPLIALKYVLSTDAKMDQILLVMPKSLIGQSKNIFIKYAPILHNIDCNICEDARQKSELNCIKIVPNYKQLILCEGKALQSFLLNNIESKTYSYNARNSVIIMDEIDTLMNPLTCELNYPLGEKTIPKYIDDVTLVIADIITKNIVDETQMQHVAKAAYVTKLFYAYIPRPNVQREWNYFIKFMRGDQINDEAEIRYDLVAVFKLLYKYFVDALGMLYNKEYGLATISYAIPYTATNQPAHGSEFSDPYLTLILTILSYNYRKLSKKNIATITKQYYVAGLQSSNPLLKYDIENILGPQSTLVEQISNGSWDLITIVDTDFELMRNNVTIFYDFISKIVVPHIKVPQEQYNSSATDIINSFFCTHRTGFSGTTNIYLPKIIKQHAKNHHNEFNEIIIDTEAVNEVAASIKGKIINGNVETSGVIKQNGTNTVDDLISLVDNYDALIDVAALLKNYANDFIAREIYQMTSRPIAYLDENGNKMIIQDGDARTYNESAIDNIFYYYDQKHTIGIDFKNQPLSMLGLVTISNASRMTDTSQGIYRLRKINRGHSVDFYIASSVLVRIRNRNDLYDYLVANEETFFNNMKERALIQNIKTNTRINAKSKVDVSNAYREKIINFLDDITRADDLYKDEINLYENYIDKYICLNNESYNRELCRELALTINRRDIIHTNLNIVQNEEQEQEQEQEREANVNAWLELEPTIIINSNLMIKLADYYHHENYRRCFGSESNTFRNGSLLAIIKYLEDANIFASPHYIVRFIQSTRASNISLGLIDGAAIIVADKYLLLTYEEFYYVSMFDNKTQGLYNKYTAGIPKNKQEYIIKFLTGNLTDLRNIIDMLREVNMGNMIESIKVIHGDNAVPFAKLYEFATDNKIEDFVELPIADVKRVLGLPQRTSDDTIRSVVAIARRILSG